MEESQTPAWLFCCQHVKVYVNGQNTETELVHQNPSTAPWGQEVSLCDNGDRFNREALSTKKGFLSIGLISLSGSHKLQSTS